MATTKKTTKKPAMKKASAKKPVVKKVAVKKVAAKTTAVKKAVAKTTTAQNKPIDSAKRDFLVLSASGVAAVGAAASVWPFVKSMQPAADVLAMSTVEQDISSIESGQMIKIMWQGKPVFIRRRTTKEIAEARNVNLSALPDPQKDEDRVLKGKEEWLVIVGICTHLGCIPIGLQGDYDGWFCPCHGSHYDTSGRVRKGPAPLNMAVPKYEFISDSVIRIGKEVT